MKLFLLLKGIIIIGLKGSISVERIEVEITPVTTELYEIADIKIALSIIASKKRKNRNARYANRKDDLKLLKAQKKIDDDRIKKKEMNDEVKKQCDLFVNAFNKAE
jgi:hypothetical protein